MPGPNELQSMYVGDDEDLSQAYASASNAPVVRAQPQATPQALTATRADAASGMKPIRDYTSTELQQLGRDYRMANPLYDTWRRGGAAADQAMSMPADAVRMRGKRERENQAIMDRGGKQKIARNQPLPNVPIAQLQPGHYSLQGVPNAEVLIKRGAKGLLVRPGGQIIVLGLDGRNVDLQEIAGGRGGPEGMPQPPGQRVVMPMRGSYPMGEGDALYGRDGIWPMQNRGQ